MKGILLILLASLSFHLFGQQYNFRQYSVEHGLPRSSVYALHEDSQGYLWVGLEGGGVAKFDGYHFEEISMTDGLPSQNVRAVIEGDNGSMWFGTTEGLVKYDEGKIKIYTEADGLVHNYVRTLCIDKDGILWIGTNGGMSTFDGKTFTNYVAPDQIPHKKVRVIIKDHMERIWVGSNGGVMIYEDGVNTEKFDITNILPDNTVLEIAEDSKSTMWLGTKNGVVAISEKDTLIYDMSHGLINNRVRAIEEDRFGDIWFGTRTGVSRFDGEEFHPYTEENRLSHNRIRDILRDSQGNLWFATYYGGLCRYSGNDFIAYTTNEGLISDQVFTINEDRMHDIIVGTFDGVSKIKFKHQRIVTINNITENSGLTGDKVYCVLKDDKDYYWHGTNFGITISKDSSFWPIGPEQGLDPEDIYTIYDDHRDQYWLGTSDGLFLIHFESIDDYQIISFPELDSLMNGSDVLAICQDPFKNIWFGYRNGDIGCLSPEGEFIKPKIDQEISNIINITLADGYLWIGTDSRGLFRVELPENGLDKVLHADNFTVKNGLGSNHIYSFLRDDKGNYWLGYENGLDKITLNSELKITHIKHYSREHGLFGQEIHENASFMDSENKLWFGTVEGAAVFNNSYDILNDKAPILHMKSVKIQGKEKLNVKQEDDFQSVYFENDIPKNLDLPYYKNSINFNFVAINLSSPEGTKYKWKLEGWDSDWSEPSRRQSVTYTNLPPGKYRFRVMASNENGIWTEQSLDINFEINAPFWQTWWFILLVVLFGLLLFMGIMRLRNRRLLKDKLKLEAQIHEATETIRKEKHVIEEQSKEIEFQKDELSEINKSITDSINYAQRIQKAIMRPNKSAYNTLEGKNFILYKPKDIVSGDFYWLKDIDSCSYIAAADCTGHGVPGAFMSMIGITYLDQIIGLNKQYDPGKILGELRNNVIEALRNESSDKAKDGMDISFCRIIWKDKRIEFSGANNPIYIIRKGELIEIKGDKMPVGEHVLDDQPFTTHHAEIEEGDMLFLFSDGYADQFGGEKGKKFMYRRFKELLIENAEKDLEFQKQKLTDAFEAWKADHEQVDDILVIGISI